MLLPLHKTALDAMDPLFNADFSDNGSRLEHLLLSDHSALSALTLVRQVPNKRYVYRAIWQGQAVYAKVFVGENNARYANRDLNGVQYLLSAKISTPPLLFSGQSHDKKAQVLIFLAIENAENAEVFWLSSDEQSRFALAKKLVVSVAQHHQAGLIQKDLYFKNFLVQNDKIYTLDGDGIRRLSFLFEKQQRRHNLATLFSKMDVLDDHWISQLCQCYCEQLGEKYSALVIDELLHLTQKIRRQVTNGYANVKVFRTCSDVKVAKSFELFTAVSNEFDVNDFSLSTLDLALLDEKSNLKNGNTCTVTKATVNDHALVIKRYNIKNCWHGINRAFRVSRAATSWANAYRLIISGISTPKPIALIESRFGVFRRRAYFLSEYIDAPDALTYFTQHRQLPDRVLVAENIATLFYKLYLLKFSHGDCKANNIKIVNGVPMLIDLDSMKAHSIHQFLAFWFEKKHIKDLKRLMNNWANDGAVSALLKEAFIKKYAQNGLIGQAHILVRAKIA